MIILLLSLVLVVGMAQGREAPVPTVRYHAETGMYRYDLGNQALTNRQEVVLEFVYPFATVTNLYLELNGQVQLIPVSELDEPTTLRAPGGWVSDTVGRSRPRIKLRAQGTVQLKSVTADCGRSKRMLQQRELSPPQAAQNETGRVQCQSSAPVMLHPYEAYYAIAAPQLSAAEMRSYSGLVNTTNRFVATFFVSNPNQQMVTGQLEIALPAWAQTANTRVYFYTVPDPIFGIPQPADTLQFNDDPPHIPAISGWAGTAGRYGYRKMATNDTMTLTWKRFRSHARETQAFSLHNPVSFKGRVRYEYLRQDGSWGVLSRSPWMTCAIPPDASRAPYQIRATCLGGIEHGNFSANGLLSIPRQLLLADDYFLPIDDGDGRGNPLAGWKVAGMETQGTQPILSVIFKLDASSNPLLLEARGMSSLTNPGPQVLVKVEVTR